MTHGWSTCRLVFRCVSNALGGDPLDVPPDPRAGTSHACARASMCAYTYPCTCRAHACTHACAHSPMHQCMHVRILHMTQVSSNNGSGKGDVLSDCRWGLARAGGLKAGEGLQAGAGRGFLGVQAAGQTILFPPSFQCGSGVCGVGQRMSCSYAYVDRWGWLAAHTLCVPLCSACSHLPACPSACLPACPHERQARASRNGLGTGTQV